MKYGLWEFTWLLGLAVRKGISVRGNQKSKCSYSSLAFISMLMVTKVSISIAVLVRFLELLHLQDNTRLKNIQVSRDIDENHAVNHSGTWTLLLRHMGHIREQCSKRVFKPRFCFASLLDPLHFASMGRSRDVSHVNISLQKGVQKTSFYATNMNNIQSSSSFIYK